MYNYGIVRCGKEKFDTISPDDYIIHRTTKVSMECLVRNKEVLKRKYKDIIVDNATLEDIMLVYSSGRYGGLLASILFAMTIGIQNVIGIVNDEKTHWKKYQMAMPLSDFSVIASKYISVVCTLGFSLLISVVYNLLSSIIFGAFDMTVWGLGFFAAIFIPLMWTGLCLPLTYWFGVQSAQVMGLLIVIPIFFLVKYFEDGLGFSAMANLLSSYLLAAGAATVVIFVISMLISTIGYAKRK